MDMEAQAERPAEVAASMVCSIPEQSRPPPPSVAQSVPVCQEVQASLSSQEVEGATKRNSKGSSSGVAEIITTATDAIITRTAPSPQFPPPSSADISREAPADTNINLVSVSNSTTSPSAAASTTSSSQQIAASCSIEPSTQLRSSHSFKRDSGLAVEESPVNPSHSPSFAATPAATQSCITSPPPRPNKRYAPSVVGAASIGGASITPSILTPEDELASRRVRSLYDSGSDIQSSYSRRGGGTDSDAGSMAVPGGRTKRLSKGMRNSLVVTDEEGGFSSEIGSGTLREEEEGELDKATNTRSYGGEEVRGNSLEIQDEKEGPMTAGGVEDWQDLEGKQVDRYGFIKPKGEESASSPDMNSPSKKPITPKKHRRLKVLINAFDGEKPEEMLQSPAVWHKDEIKEKEVERAKKWKAMAMSMTDGTKTSRWKRGKSAEKLTEGPGGQWKFATKDPKLISRTWKGIPDCWRAAAWHAFLTSSAEKRGNCLPDDELKAIYHELVERGSADDVQIDLDVPRTISSHIMFRRRYRGGQRLLFRVLHAISLHFPEVGYVQGMAALAATLLCYYDEETTFIMMVRLWELRGLGKLYEPGFGGLMEALNELENKWLKGGLVSQKLENLGIEPTAYGTKWYLTLFNYSLPFPAQLRVWDVFMLLGDPDSAPTPRHSGFSLHFGHHQSKSENDAESIAPAVGFSGTLDIIHATSTALIDGMKEMILNADFETAMKALTSWIPVKDEELLMKVAKAEWKLRRRRRHFGSSNSSSGLFNTAPASPTTSQHKARA